MQAARHFDVDDSARVLARGDPVVSREGRRGQRRHRLRQPDLITGVAIGLSRSRSQLPEVPAAVIRSLQMASPVIDPKDDDVLAVLIGADQILV